MKSSCIHLAEELPHRQKFPGEFFLGGVLGEKAALNSPPFFGAFFWGSWERESMKEP